MWFLTSFHLTTRTTSYFFISCVYLIHFLGRFVLFIFKKKKKKKTATGYIKVCIVRIFQIICQASKDFMTCIWIPSNNNNKTKTMITHIINTRLVLKEQWLFLIVCLKNFITIFHILPRLIHSGGRGFNSFYWIYFTTHLTYYIRSPPLWI